jgi:signal transduction histidine kinase
MMPLSPGRLARRVRDRLVAGCYDRLLDDLDHDLRGPLTVIRGEVELVLSQSDVPPDERQRSSTTVIEQVVEIERLLGTRYGDDA